MSLSKEFRKRFLEKTEHTGRCLVTSFRTGKTYAIEPLDGKNVKWGDVNPATGEVEGNYGSKYKGSIPEKDSLITEENGFINIVKLNPGEGPESYINRIDDTYPDKMTVE